MSTVPRLAGVTLVVLRWALVVVGLLTVLVIVFVVVQFHRTGGSYFFPPEHSALGAALFYLRQPHSARWET